MENMELSTLFDFYFFSICTSQSLHLYLIPVLPALTFAVNGSGEDGAAPHREYQLSIVVQKRAVLHLGFRVL